MSIQLLPNELLIILLSKIQEYTRDAYEDKLTAARKECEIYKNIFAVFLQIQNQNPYGEIHGLSISFCKPSFHDCDKYQISFQGIVYYQSDNMLICDRCNDCKCLNHNDGYIRQAIEEGHLVDLCPNCID